MEYSADGTTYIACAGTEVVGLAEGTYYVRVAPTANHEAGAAATVKVPAYSMPPAGSNIVWMQQEAAIKVR